jgi:hypothetical protein
MPWLTSSDTVWRRSNPGKSSRGYRISGTEKEGTANSDGFVKSPSAALRFNFVFAAHPISALHSSVFARLSSGAFYETIVPVTF